MNTLHCSAFALRKARGLRASLGRTCMVLLPLSLSLLLGSTATGVQAATWRKVAVAVVIGAVGLTQGEGVHKLPDTSGGLIDSGFADGGGQGEALHTHPMEDYSVEIPAPLDAQAPMIPDFSIPHRLESAIEGFRPAEREAMPVSRNLLSNPYKIDSLLHPIPRSVPKAAPLSANGTTTSTTRATSTTQKPKGEKDIYDKFKELEWYGQLGTGVVLAFLVLSLCIGMTCADTRSCPCCPNLFYLLCFPLSFFLCCHICRIPDGGFQKGWLNFGKLITCWWCWARCCKRGKKINTDSQEYAPQELQKMVTYEQTQTFSNTNMKNPTTLLTMPDHS